MGRREVITVANGLQSMGIVIDEIGDVRWDENK